MNEQITETVSRMFAPNPIPQCVVVAIDQAVFLMNKIDAPAFNGRDLCIIAGCALAGSGTTSTAVVEPREAPDPMAPIPIAPDGVGGLIMPDAPDKAATKAAPVPQGGRMDAPPQSSDRSRAATYDQLRTMERGELEAHAEMLGLSIPASLSDEQVCDFILGRPIQHPPRTPKVPTTAAPTLGANARRKGVSESKMLKLTLAQLRDHALVSYGYKAPVRYKKDVLAAVLQQMTPII